jgi:hypothetical protein
MFIGDGILATTEPAAESYRPLRYKEGFARVRIAATSKRPLGYLSEIEGVTWRGPLSDPEESEALHVFLRVAADPRFSWRALELADRGISADAASVTWAISEAKRSLSGEELSGLLTEQSDLVDSLTESWQSFERGEISGAEFEMHLERVVIGLEGWISRASRK